MHMVRSVENLIYIDELPELVRSHINYLFGNFLLDTAYRVSETCVLVSATAYPCLRLFMCGMGEDLLLRKNKLH